MFIWTGWAGSTSHSVGRSSTPYFNSVQWIPIKNTKQQKQSSGVILWKLPKIHRKTPVPESKACNFIKNWPWHRCLLVEFLITYFCRTPPVAASETRWANYYIFGIDGGCFSYLHHHNLKNIFESKKLFLTVNM